MDTYWPGAGDAVKFAPAPGLSVEDCLARLPITMYLRGRIKIFAPLAFMIGLLILAGEIVFVPLLVTSILADAKRDKTAYIAFLHPGWMFWFLTYLAFAMVMIGLARLGDLMQSGPLLTIAADGLQDLRFSAGPIPWADIDTYEVSYAKHGRVPLSATLYLRRPPAGPLRRWRLLLRAIAALKRPKPTVLRLDLLELAPRSEDTCQVIITLAQHHGAKQHRHWFEPQV